MRRNSTQRGNGGADSDETGQALRVLSFCATIVTESIRDWG